MPSPHHGGQEGEQEADEADAEKTQAIHCSRIQSIAVASFVK